MSVSSTLMAMRMIAAGTGRIALKLLMLPEGYYKVTLRTYNLEGELSSNGRKRILRVGKRVPGDLNDDGHTTQTDVRKLSSYLLGDGSEILDPAIFSVADLNGDGVVNGFDLVLLRQMVK